MKRNWVFVLLAMMLVLSACSSSSVGSGGSGASNKVLGPEGKTIEIATMTADPYLEEAVKQYKKLRPDIQIEIKEYLASPQSNEDGMVQAGAAFTQADIEKYVQTVSTQMMSGKGADIIAMNDLPQDKYVQKNMLVNLYDYMDKDSEFKKEQYYENIFESSQDGDGLYAMPFSFVLDALTGDKELLDRAKIQIEDQNWTWDDFRDIAKKLKEQAGEDYVAFVNLFPIQLLADYIEANYDKLIDNGKANFDSELFRDMMKQIKSLYDEGVLNAEFTYDYSKSLFNNALLLDPIMGLSQIMDPKLQIYQKPTVNGESRGTSFKSYFTLGINSKSKVQDEAWNFIKFMLSEDMQSSPTLQSFPMHKGVVEKKFKDAEEQAIAGTLLLLEQKFDAKTVESKIEELKQLIDGANTNLSSDQKVVSIAIEAFDSYMSGQKSAEDVSKLIQNRVNTYINE